MKNYVCIAVLAALCFCACSKEIEQPQTRIDKKEPSKSLSFTQYTISKGAQYCDTNNFVAVKLIRLSFKVKFDSSAIYTTGKAENQKDINKLFGFSDNNALHHEYSARFGWRWSDNALRIFAYDYNNGTRSFKELGTIQIGAENSCSITVSGNKYIFNLNGAETVMPRASTTELAEGYQLYPYFGGDESAPHVISIWIEELP
jgi:hypothetical protein